MAKRQDIQKILIIGAGPIVIGQACEFDYSGVQACRALKEEGYQTVLVNSNPATIMTDPNLADATYIEPIAWPVVAKIIEKERPDALLATMGGQTALNCALDLAKEGVLAKYQVELIGASIPAINKAEDREQFRQAMTKIGLSTAASRIAHTLEEAEAAKDELGFPLIIRPSFTLGGTGGGIAYNHDELVEICESGFELSPTNELLIEESVLGWKEFEMEVVRDKQDNCIIVCSIENFDPMGVHTGDSITVAPAQTLTDKEYQQMRNASIAILREIGVETGGSNVQFAVNPKNGKMIVIEMNPRVSRSSALASKATGFPIAKVAAKLAVGYTLDELRNDITQGAIPVSFEPTIDYVVTKIPRFNFDKFPQTAPILTTQMKSVGEVMAIGRTFQESLQKAIRGLETGRCGLIPLLTETDEKLREEKLLSVLKIPGPDRLWYIADAFRHGKSVEFVHRCSQVDPWFLWQIHELICVEQSILHTSISHVTRQALQYFKQKGFSDECLAELWQCGQAQVRAKRAELMIAPVFKKIDSCAAEFPTTTNYLYSTYDQECEVVPSHNKKILILGSGPNRIGQGIEFDYCCVHAAMAMREAGYETIMINCNPETVSTDYDISDRLYFESLTLEDVLAVIDKENPQGVIVQYGGQTPLKLAKELEALGVNIIGTSPSAIDRAEDRALFRELVQKIKIQQPANCIVRTLDEGLVKAQEIGYPLVVRPSYVLGGRAMEIVYSAQELTNYLQKTVHLSPASPVLLDSFLQNAIEVDVDAVSDGSTVIIAGIMEHIEQAGIHSGDSSCSLPPFTLSQSIQNQLKEMMIKLALELQVCGLMNAQFAIKEEQIYIIEVNPRASRTVPYISKALGIPLAKIAARCMVGETLADQGHTKDLIPKDYTVKVPVFPFNKFAAVDPILGPEMRSTGEVMGFGQTFAQAYEKAQMAAGVIYQNSGTVLISVKDVDKDAVVSIAQGFVELGFTVLATGGTEQAIRQAGVQCTRINKVLEGRPHIVDAIKNKEINFIVNTTEGRQAIADSYTIRRSALQQRVNYTTTLAGARAVLAVLQQKNNTMVVKKLQEIK